MPCGQPSVIYACLRRLVEWPVMVSGALPMLCPHPTAPPNPSVGMDDVVTLMPAGPNPTAHPSVLSSSQPHSNHTYRIRYTTHPRYRRHFTACFESCRRNANAAGTGPLWLLGTQAVFRTNQPSGGSAQVTGVLEVMCLCRPGSLNPHRFTSPALSMSPIKHRKHLQHLSRWVPACPDASVHFRHMCLYMLPTAGSHPEPSTSTSLTPQASETSGTHQKSRDCDHPH